MQIRKEVRGAQLDLPGIGGETEIIDSVFDLNAGDVERLKKRKPKALGIVCGRSDCERGLHCFGPNRDINHSSGACRSCGVNLIDWAAFRARSLGDVDAKFNLLGKEWIRHFFFHVPITPRIEWYAAKHGYDGLADAIESQIQQPKMLRFMPALDWNQTAMLDGTIVHWARHATACCCRACMKYWHNIPFDHELGREDADYFKHLVMHYVRLRMPDLEPRHKKPVAGTASLSQGAKVN
jgi:hypothetical protein